MMRFLWDVLVDGNWNFLEKNLNYRRYLKKTDFLWQNVKINRYSKAIRLSFWNLKMKFLFKPLQLETQEFVLNFG